MSAMLSRAPHIAFVLVVLVGAIFIVARHYSTGPRTHAVLVSIPATESGSGQSSSTNETPSDIGASSKGEIVSGQAEVVDADTLRMNGERIRLFGIDAIEAEQRCSTDAGSWDCGAAATKALALRLAGRRVVCEGSKRDQYHRLLAKCRVDNDDIGEWLVTNGWAFAFRRYSQDYVAAEQRAKAGSAGLWRSQFIFPWEWRKNKR